MLHPSIAQLVGSCEQLSPLNGTAQKVLALSEGERFSAQQLAEAVVSEPVLATRVLRIANSAFYGAPRRVSSVREAIVLIGFPTVRSTVMAMCLIDAWPRSGAIDGPRFWRHAVSVATLAESFAAGTGCGVDQAFTAGVVHNIGRLALAQCAPASLLAVTARARTAGLTVHEAERELLGYTDAALGGALARCWNFPEVLVEAIAASEQRAPAVGVGPVAAVVIEARAVVALAGVTDGVDVAAFDARRTDLPKGWDGVARRVDAFLEHVLPVF